MAGYMRQVETKSWGAPVVNCTYVWKQGGRTKRSGSCFGAHSIADTRASHAH